MRRRLLYMDWTRPGLLICRILACHSQFRRFIVICVSYRCCAWRRIDDDLSSRDTERGEDRLLSVREMRPHTRYATSA